MSKENVKLSREIIRNYISDNANITDINANYDNFDFFESGILNSLFTIEMMIFLEKTFDIKITMDDLDMENFKSISATAAFVELKRGEKNASV